MKAAVLPFLTVIGPALAGFDTWSPPGPYDGMDNNIPSTQGEEAWTSGFVDANPRKPPAQSEPRAPC